MGSTKLCHQRWHWVDQLLRLHLGLAWHRQHGEGVVLRLEAWRTWLSKDVLFVMTWLQASSNITDFFWLCYCQIFNNRIVLPAGFERVNSNNFFYNVFHLNWCPAVHKGLDLSVHRSHFVRQPTFEKILIISFLTCRDWILYRFAPLKLHFSSSRIWSYNLDLPHKGC